MKVKPTKVKWVVNLLKNLTFPLFPPFESNEECRKPKTGKSSNLTLFSQNTSEQLLLCTGQIFTITNRVQKKKKKSHSRYEVNCLLISCLLKITFYRSWQKFWPNSCFRLLYQQWSFTLRAFYEEGLQRLKRVTLPQH